LYGINVNTFFNQLERLVLFLSNQTIHNKTIHGIFFGTVLAVKATLPLLQRLPSSVLLRITLMMSLDWLYSTNTSWTPDYT